MTNPERWVCPHCGCSWQRQLGDNCLYCAERLPAAVLQGRVGVYRIAVDKIGAAHPGRQQEGAQS